MECEICKKKINFFKHKYIRKRCDKCRYSREQTKEINEKRRKTILQGIKEGRVKVRKGKNHPSYNHEKRSEIKKCLICNKRLNSYLVLQKRKTCGDKKCIRKLSSIKNTKHYGPKYFIVRKQGRQMTKHRHIMEQYLGRKLTKNEIVHHINGDISDNKIENLQVMTRGEHCKLHLHN